MQISPPVTQTITQQSATKAFEDWENDYRANPASFYTEAEVAAMKVATLSEQRTIHFLALLRQGGNTTPPIPGQYWADQKGWYAGICRSEDGLTGWHLILPDVPECYIEDVAWGEYGKKIKGADLQFDGLANTVAMAAAGSELALRIRELPGDCYLPSRFESALLYAMLRDQIKQGDWYWTSTQTSAGNAWVQDFSYGIQNDNIKYSTGRARAVRRLSLQSFSPLDR